MWLPVVMFSSFALYPQVTTHSSNEHGSFVVLLFDSGRENQTQSKDCETLEKRLGKSRLWSFADVCE